MAYSKQTWENLPNQTTPITAERLNHMEDGIYEAWEHGGGSETLPIGSEIDYDGNTVPTGWEQISDTAQILWTNSSPTSGFSAQSITLDSDDYDILEFYFKSFNSNDDVVSTRTIKGHNANLQTLYLDAGKIDIVNRIATYVSDTSYSISTGNIVQAPGTSSAFTTNSQCIPLYVIGYKTGLFNQGGNS